MGSYCNSNDFEEIKNRIKNILGVELIRERNSVDNPKEKDDFIFDMFSRIDEMDLKKIEGLLIQGLKLNTDLEMFWAFLGYVYYVNGDFKKSIKCFFRTIEIEPTNIDNWLDLAFAYRAFGDFKISDFLFMNYSDAIKKYLTDRREFNSNTLYTIWHNLEDDKIKDNDLEYMQGNEALFDYCLYEYSTNIPYKGKIKSINLLKESIGFAKIDPDFFSLIDLIRFNLGERKTVWGVKKINDSIKWELYFYNYGKKDPAMSISNFLNIVNPYLKSNLKIDENIPYFMFSADIDESSFKNKKLDGINIYVPNNVIHSGKSYLITENDFIEKNFYYFYDPKIEIRDIINRVKSSKYLDFNKVKLSDIILPELMNCKSICVANKNGNDCIYFSGINMGQFIFFLKKFDYPSEIISFIEKNEDYLDYLQYDVGFDYVMDGDNIKIIKSGYYGIF